MAFAQKSGGEASHTTSRNPIPQMAVPNPRERSIPLVPTPFAFDSRWPPFDVHDSKSAKKRHKFIPNIKVDEYETSLTGLERLALRDRAKNLSKRASSNYRETSSEFWTEVLAWRYVFQQFYEDPKFRIDKRPYDFLDTNRVSGAKTVKQRIPDATIGLRSFSKIEISHKPRRCKEQKCRVCREGVVDVDERLSNSDLFDMQFEPECALVVDGVWGEQHLLFPFAAYEAKKSGNQHQDAFAQVSHACATYLGMLDDLARNPYDVGRYQTPESATYQMFAFISCGSNWEVYIASAECDSCCINTVWRGNVSDPDDAYELLCLVNQIYHFAVHQHIPFVTTHLQRWLDRFDRLRNSPAQRGKGPIGLQLAKINPGIDQYFKSFPEEDRPHLHKVPRQVRIANGALEQYRKITKEFRQAKDWRQMKADSRGSKRNKGKEVQQPIEAPREHRPPSRVIAGPDSGAVSKLKLRRSRRPRETGLLGLFKRERERLGLHGRDRPSRNPSSNGQSNAKPTGETIQTGQPAVETSSNHGNLPARTARHHHA